LPRYDGKTAGRNVDDATLTSSVKTKLAADKLSSLTRVDVDTASIPSSAYLGVAVGAMGLSLLCQVAGQGKWGNFIAQWVPTLLIIGLHNEAVKVEGHDRTDRGSAAY
jgi:hypothetical protein